VSRSLSVRLRSGVRTVQRHRGRAAAFRLPPCRAWSPVLGLVLALALSCPAGAQDADILVKPYEWEGGGKEYTLVAVPEPYFEGREPAMQQVLQGFFGGPICSVTPIIRPVTPTTPWPPTKGP
jgi:hypothetical protein